MLKPFSKRLQKHQGSTEINNFLIFTPRKEILVGTAVGRPATAVRDAEMGGIRRILTARRGLKVYAKISTRAIFRRHFVAPAAHLNFRPQISYNRVQGLHGRYSTPK